MAFLRNCYWRNEKFSINGDVTLPRTMNSTQRSPWILKEPLNWKYRSFDTKREINCNFLCFSVRPGCWAVYVIEIACVQSIFPFAITVVWLVPVWRVVVTHVVPVWLWSWARTINSARFVFQEKEKKFWQSHYEIINRNEFAESSFGWISCPASIREKCITNDTYRGYTDKADKKADSKTRNSSSTQFRHKHPNFCYRHRNGKSLMATPSFW